MSFVRDTIFTPENFLADVVGDVFGFVGEEVIEPVVSPLAEGIAPLFESFAALIEGIIKPISDALGPGLGRITGSIEGLAPLFELWAAILGKEVSSFGDVGDVLLRSLFGSLISSLGTELGPLRRFAETLVERAFPVTPGSRRPRNLSALLGATFLPTQAAVAMTDMGHALSGVEGSWGESVEKALGGLEKSLNSVEGGFSTRMVNALEGRPFDGEAEATPAAFPILAPLAGLAEPLAKGLFYVFSILAIATLGGDSRDPKAQPPTLTEWWEKAVALLGGAAEQVVTVGAPLVQAAQSPIQRFWEAIANTAVEQMDFALDSLPLAAPENVSGVASDLAGKAIQFGVFAHLSSTALGLLPGMKHLGLSQFPALIAGMAAFAPIAQAQVGEKTFAALRRPARQAANRQFPTEIPEAFLADQMFTKRDIEEREWRRVYELNGFPPEWVAAFRKGVFRELSSFDLARFADSEAADDDWLVEKARRAQFDDADVERIFVALKNLVNRQARGAVVTAAQAAFKDGIIDEAGFRSVLTEANYREDTIDFYALGARIQALRDDTTDIISGARSALRAGAMDLSDYRGVLSGLGLRSDKIASLVSREEAIAQGRAFRDDVRAKDKEERQIFNEQIRVNIEAFRRDLISAAELRANLVNLGLDPELAIAKTSLQEIRREPVVRVSRRKTPEELAEDIKRLEIRNVETAVRRGLLSAEEAFNNLVLLGMDPFEARARIRLQVTISSRPPEEPEPPGPTSEELQRRRVERATAFERFRRREIAAEDLRLLLEQAGTDPAVASAEVEREELRLAAAELQERERAAERLLEQIRREEERANLDAFKKGFLTEGELFFNLVALGIEPELAEAKVTRAAIAATEAAGTAAG